MSDHFKFVFVYRGAKVRLAVEDPSAIVNKAAMSLIETFIAELTSYLLPTDTDNQSAQKLITFYETSGYDFSFPVSLKIWENYSPALKETERKQSEDNILVFSRGRSVEDCLRQLEKDSFGWTFTIETAVCKQDRFVVKLYLILVKNYF